MIVFQDERLEKYRSEVITANYKEINERKHKFYVEHSLSYKEFFDPIYKIEMDELTKFYNEWESKEDWTYLRFIAIRQGKYVCVDKTIGHWFVEEYDSLEKAMLYFNSPIDYEYLYHHSIDECLDYLENTLER